MIKSDKEILTPAVEMYLGKKRKVQLAGVETENPLLKKRRLEEDNTINIVCLDETSSSSNSNVIQSAGRTVRLTLIIIYRHSLFALLYVTVYVNFYFCLNFILKAVLFKINFSIISAIIVILVTTRIDF